MNLIKGTSGRDNIIGTEGRDYIIAGAGQDFYVLGGAGADVFEVNLGDEVIRIADFTLGEDVISLETPRFWRRRALPMAAMAGTVSISGWPTTR